MTWRVVTVEELRRRGFITGPIFVHPDATVEMEYQTDGTAVRAFVSIEASFGLEMPRPHPRNLTLEEAQALIDAEVERQERGRA